VRSNNAEIFQRVDKNFNEWIKIVDKANNIAADPPRA
jgi:hypothetical protein